MIVEHKIRITDDVYNGRVQARRNGERIIDFFSCAIQAICTKHKGIWLASDRWNKGDKAMLLRTINDKIERTKRPKNVSLVSLEKRKSTYLIFCITITNFKYH